MLHYYLTITLRTIERSKGFAFINIFGLAVGIACCILILLWVRGELSYDRYHENADRIYRAGVHAVVYDNEFHAGASCAPLAQALIDEFPEVKAVTRLVKGASQTVQHEENTFNEDRWYFADSTVFDVFTIPFIQGNPETALNEPNTVVITRSMATKYFGDDTAIGKSFILNTRSEYRIAGVIEDTPRNSHVHYDFLASMATIGDSRNQNWISNNYPTYFVLREGVAAENFEAKLPSLIEKYVYPQVEGALGVTPEQFYASGGMLNYFIQPLTDIHLRSHLQFEHEPNGDITYVYIFSIIAVALLVIASVNFINLTTARAITRAKEVGIRKAVGSGRRRLMTQFVAEGIWMSLFAVALSLLVFELLLPPFNAFTGKEVGLAYFESMVTIPALLVTGSLVGLASSIYPAFYLASMNPVLVLKGQMAGGKSQSWLRNGLVIFQFTISTILIIGTFVVFDQVRYAQNKNLGFDGDQIIVVKNADDLRSQYGAFIQELSRYPGVVTVSSSSDLMGNDFGDDLYHAADDPDQANQLIRRMWTDAHFADTYSIELAAGRYFSEDNPNENEKLVLNELAVLTLGLTDPVGKMIIDMDGGEHEIIGVVEDFHFQTLSHEINPLAIDYLGHSGVGTYLSVRSAPNAIQETLEQLENTWNTFSGGQAFEYEFFDDYFAGVFLAERRTGQIYLAFSLVALFIAGLGLLGLAAYITGRRTKEIGIRKVMGASASGILFLLHHQYTRWIFISNLIAWPIAYYVMYRWLQGFAYRVDIGFLPFIATLAITIAASLLVVSFHTIKAAKTNPIDILRYE